MKLATIDDGSRDVAMGTKAEDGGPYVKLIVLINDVSLRRIAPIEFRTDVGFLQSKASDALPLTAVTPDTLGSAFNNSHLERSFRILRNVELFGMGDVFSFHRLMDHWLFGRTALNRA